MHRDVKPHNVMIDHEKRKVKHLRTVVGASLLIDRSCGSLIGVLRSFTTKAQNTTSESHRDTSKDPSF